MQFFTAIFHCFKEVLNVHSSIIIIIMDNVHLHMVHMCHVEPPRGGALPLNFTPYAYRAQENIFHIIIKGSICLNEKSLSIEGVNLKVTDQR